AGLEALIGAGIPQSAASALQFGNDLLAAPGGDAADDMARPAVAQDFRAARRIAVGIALRVVFDRLEFDGAFRIGIDVRDGGQRAPAAGIGNEPIIAGTRIQDADFEAAPQPYPQKRKCLANPACVREAYE